MLRFLLSYKVELRERVKGLLFNPIYIFGALNSKLYVNSVFYNIPELFECEVLRIELDLIFS